MLTVGLTNRISAGTSDNFAGPEPSSPSAGLRTWLAGLSANLEGFDACALNGYFAHTMANLPDCITNAHLEVRFKSCGAASFNDTLSLAFTGANGVQTNGWSRYLGTLGNAEAGLLPGNWNDATNGQVFDFDLSALPLAAGGTTNLLPLLNQYHFLDLICQNDSAVDYLVLDVTSSFCHTNLSVDCGSTWGFTTPTAVDACSGTNVTLTIETTTNGPCLQSATYALTATDPCGNSSQVTVTVLDTTPPLLTRAADKTVNAGSGWTFDPPTAIDACCGTGVTITVLNTVTNGTNPQVITRTWQATDCCNNSATCSQTVTVVSTTSLVMTCAGNKTVECGSGWSFDPPAPNGACANTNLTLTILSTVTNGLCPQVITRTWLATDTCGNANTCSQTVTVVDTTPPILTCAGDQMLLQGSPWSFGWPTANDACAGNEVSVIVLDTTTNGACPEVITRTWLATDLCGNASLCSQNVNLFPTTGVFTIGPALSASST